MMPASSNGGTAVRLQEKNLSAIMGD
jgi:hypothetical protein